MQRMVDHGDTKLEWPEQGASTLEVGNLKGCISCLSTVLGDFK